MGPRTLSGSHPPLRPNSLFLPHSGPKRDTGHMKSASRDRKAIPLSVPLRPWRLVGPFVRMPLEGLPPRRCPRAGSKEPRPRTVPVPTPEWHGVKGRPPRAIPIPRRAAPPSN